MRQDNNYTRTHFPWAKYLLLNKIDYFIQERNQTDNFICLLVLLLSFYNLCVTKNAPEFIYDHKSLKFFEIK